MKIHDIVLSAARFSVLWSGGPVAALKRAPTFLNLLLIKGDAVCSVHMYLMKETVD